MGKDSPDKLLPETLEGEEGHIIFAKRYFQQSVLTLLKNVNLRPLTYDSFPDLKREDALPVSDKKKPKPIFYHSFDISDPPKPDTLTFSFHIMQDMKDAALKMLREAGSNLFYNRVLLQNVFLLLRHMILFERRLTLWYAPEETYKPSELCQYYFKRYSPFFLYRDIWATMLAPYWKTQEYVQADHIRQTVADYFAQLLPTHPCWVISCEKVKISEKKCRCQKDNDENCKSCCLPKDEFCGEENFPQKNCGERKKLDPALVAAFAECVYRNGMDKTENKNQLKDAAQTLLKAVFAAAKALHPELMGQLWLFLAAYIWYKEDSPAKRVLAAKPEDVIPTTEVEAFELPNDSQTAADNGKTILDKQAPADAEMMATYAAACKAADVKIGYSGDWKKWLNEFALEPSGANVTIWYARLEALLPKE